MHCTGGNQCILATLQEPDEGSITLGNLDVLNQKAEVRRRLGYLSQEFGVYPKVSTEELLDYFAVLKGITGRAARKEAVESLLRQTNLWEERKQRLGSYLCLTPPVSNANHIHF